MSSADDTVEVLPPADQPAQDPAMAALLGALSSGGDPLSLLYSQIGAANPQAAMLLQVMEQRRAQTAAQIKDIEDDEACEEHCRHVKPEPGTVNIKEEDLRALHDAARKAGDELEILRTRNDALARALGACCVCFGDDPLCPECAGVGSPGSLMPEPAEFRLYVVPALKRVRAAERIWANGLIVDSFKVCGRIVPTARYRTPRNRLQAGRATDSTMKKGRY